MGPIMRGRGGGASYNYATDLGTHANWWNAVGTMEIHGGGIPAVFHKTAQTMELSVCGDADAPVCFDVPGRITFRARDRMPTRAGTAGTSWPPTELYETVRLAL